MESIFQTYLCYKDSLEGYKDSLRYLEGFSMFIFLCFLIASIYNKAFPGLFCDESIFRLFELFFRKILVVMFMLSCLCDGLTTILYNGEIFFKGFNLFLIYGIAIFMGYNEKMKWIISMTFLCSSLTVILYDEVLYKVFCEIYFKGFNFLLNHLLIFGIVLFLNICGYSGKKKCFMSMKEIISFSKKKRRRAKEGFFPRLFRSVRNTYDHADKKHLKSNMECFFAISLFLLIHGFLPITLFIVFKVSSTLAFMICSRNGNLYVGFSAANYSMYGLFMVSTIRKNSIYSFYLLRIFSKSLYVFTDEEENVDYSFPIAHNLHLYGLLVGVASGLIL